MDTKPKLGSGGRFAALQEELGRRGARDPAAIAASIGRRKYGAAKFQAMAAKGARRKAAAEPGEPDADDK